MSDPLNPGQSLPKRRPKDVNPAGTRAPAPPATPEEVAVQAALLESCRPTAPGSVEQGGDEIMPITDDMLPRPAVNSSADNYLHDVADFHYEGEEIPPETYMTQQEQEAHAEAVAKRESEKRRAERKVDKKIGSMLKNIMECIDILKETEVSFFSNFLVIFN